MNPGLVVKLRPSGPWRIGPDSGARNRVDFIYHSDSLYSAVTSAMARLGSLDEWLDATARRAEGVAPPAVCFSSCFPFLDEIGFVVPPRTIWPPTSPALLSARVRWKSARFVPLGIVQAILAGQRLDENHWSVDGASECLVPAGRPGPFRTGIRSSAAVDRLTGSTERHSMACIEFRAGAGLWTIVSFVDEAAHNRWLNPVKAAFRVLADTGFGGERSRGWGRAESPEFIDGTLPDMILPPSTSVGGQVVDLPGAVAAEPVSTEPDPGVPAQTSAEPISDGSALVAEPAPSEPPLENLPPIEDPQPEPPLTEPPSTNPPSEDLPEKPAEPPEAAAALKAPSELSALAQDSSLVPPALEPGPPSAELVPPVPEPEPPATELVPPTPEPAHEPVPPINAPDPPTREPFEPTSEPAPSEPEPTPATSRRLPATELHHPHWLLSLFTPAPADAVDWRRGNYTMLARGGRVDSPAGSGELKKQIQMVAEGSVVYAPTGPCGSAADVAPDGFAHPVFRAGFAVSIPLPEVS